MANLMASSIFLKFCTDKIWWATKISGKETDPKYFIYYKMTEPKLVSFFPTIKNVYPLMALFRRKSMLNAILIVLSLEVTLKVWPMTYRAGGKVVLTFIV